MAVREVSETINCTNDADYVDACTKLAAHLDVAFERIPQTGDLNTFVGLTRPATNGTSGFRLYRVRSSSVNTFIKVLFGVGSPNTVFALRFQFGDGTDGSGNLTNANPGTPLVVNFAATGVTSYPSFSSGGTGYGAIVFQKGVGSGLSERFSIVANQSVDAEGNYTAEGINLTINYGTANAYALWGSFAGVTNPFYDSGLSGIINCVTPLGRGFESFVDSKAQVLLHFGRFPRIAPLMNVLTVMQDEFGDVTTFTASPVGTGLKTYLVLHNAYSYTTSVANSGPTSDKNLCLAIRWEE